MLNAVMLLSTALIKQATGLSALFSLAGLDQTLADICVCTPVCSRATSTLIGTAVQHLRRTCKQKFRRYGLA